MLKLIEEEEEEERKCRVTTRSGKETKVQEDEEQEQEDGESKVQPTPTQTCEQATTPGSGPRPSLLTEDEAPKSKPKFTFRHQREQEERRKHWEEFHSTEGGREEPQVLEVPRHPTVGEDGAENSEQAGESEYAGSLVGDEGGLPPTHHSEESLTQLVLEEDWSEEYEKCPVFGGIWKATLSAEQDWPEGTEKSAGKLYADGKLCIPLRLQNAWIQEQHRFWGHVGFQRLWETLSDRFFWAKSPEAKEYARRVGRECTTCQACDPPLSLKTKIRPFPIPSKIMSHVSIDLFKMPRLSKDKIFYDTLIICVDRHSGWIIALPSLEKGLTGERVAKLMLQQWRWFGVPQVIHSDRGPHFISSWWQTLCAGLGIRVSYSHAYHHQGNGRAERAGRQIQDLARKIHVETGMDWFDSLPQVVDRIHDVPGEGGYTPYQIIFGRDRPLGGVPYSPSRFSEDAEDFIQRIKEVDEKVAQTLNEKHRRQAEQVNKGRKDGPRLKPGDKVWYRRPEGTGEKTDSRWLGPGIVVEQVVMEVTKSKWRRKESLKHLKSF